MGKRKEFFSTGGITESNRSIHTPGNFAKRNLLFVQEVGRLKSLTPHRCVREKLDSYLFIVVLSGSGQISVLDHEYKVGPGDCALIHCMDHYEHISDPQNAWSLAWVHFNGICAHSYYELFHRYNHQSNVFNTGDFGSWNDLIGRLMEKQEDKSPLADLECGEILLHLMNQVISGVMDREMVVRESEKKLLNEVREAFNEDYVNERVIEDTAERLGMSVQELDEKFQRHFGISMDEYIANRCFNVAKEMLRFTIKPIDQVIVESGLKDVVTMQRMFRENENMSAEEYRMKWAQWIK